MRAETRERPSAATAVAAFSALAALLVAGRLVHAQFAPSAPPEPQRCCASPVEVVQGSESRLGCAADQGLSACGVLAAGDRVRLGANGCQRDVAGMRPALRLLSGLRVDLNAATADELELIDGVGPSVAREIVAYRDAHGRFSSVAALDDVRGVGPSSLEQLRKYTEVVAQERK